MSTFRVNSFRNCPNPDCNAHDRPQPYQGDLPSEGKERLRGEMLEVCIHCGSVWYERETSDGKRTYYIVGNRNTDTWYEKVLIYYYRLKRTRR